MMSTQAAHNAERDKKGDRHTSGLEFLLYKMHNLFSFFEQRERSLNFSILLLINIYNCVF